MASKPTANVTVTEKTSHESESPSLKTAVDGAVKAAESGAKTGNVETVPETKGGPATDLPTGTRRSHPA